MIPESISSMKMFEELIDYHDEVAMVSNTQMPDRICQYCCDKFRKGLMPSRCVLNKLEIVIIPDCIKVLNEFERILIQRAKAFCTTLKMNTVLHGHNKFRPNDSITKIKGRVFHLPLPLKEPLEKLPESAEAINKKSTFLCFGAWG